jgi:hypothetical protein
MGPRRWRKEQEPPVSGIDDPNSDDFHPRAPVRAPGYENAQWKPRDLDKLPEAPPPAAYGPKSARLAREREDREARQPPAKREIPTIRNDIRLNNKRRVELEEELAQCSRDDVALTAELGTALDEIERLCREVRAEHNLEPQHGTPAIQPPPPAGLPDRVPAVAADLDHHASGDHRLPVPGERSELAEYGFADERDQQGGRLPDTRPSSGDDEIPF